MGPNFNPPAHCTYNGRNPPPPPPCLQKAVGKITAQVVQMTTSENVILYDMGTQ